MSPSSRATRAVPPSVRSSATPSSRRPRRSGTRRSRPASSTRSTREAPPRMVLREAFDYEFSRLDPTGDHIDPPSVAIYETVLAKGPDWGAHPVLAESWEHSRDGLEWRVRLRPGLRFHSGAPCDAPAVLDSLEHLRWMVP